MLEYKNENISVLILNVEYAKDTETEIVWEVLMCIFDENVTDNITSYLACHCCSEMLEYEKIYNEE